MRKIRKTICKAALWAGAAALVIPAIALAPGLSSANPPRSQPPKSQHAAVQPAQAARGGAAAPAQPMGQEHVATTHILVRVRPGVIPAALADGRPTFQLENAVADRAADDLGRALQRGGAAAIQPAMMREPARPELARALGLDRWHRIEIAPGATAAGLAQLAADLRRFEAIELAELDGLGGVASSMEGSPPNDPQFGLQYGLHNTGQSIGGVPGTPGADISALGAWSISTGSNDLILAIIDSGVNPHDDLVGRLVPGYNIVQNNDDTADVCGAVCGGHGTHVAGIAAANVNNALGIAGVDREVKVMPVVVLNAQCSGNEDNAGLGVMWAADNGAHVINLSLQYDTGTTLFHDRIVYARQSGCVIIAAAGNFNSVIAFPARWSEVVAVAATTNMDERWLSSNQGPELSVAAPGHNVRSLTGFSTYGYCSGTSMASPHVAGVACLMLALDPTLTHDDIEGFLQSTAADLGPPGFDNQFGHGRINAHAALQAVLDSMSIPGDLNGDGYVDVQDLLILLSSWGPCPDPPADCPADLNDSGTVDVQDLLILLANWG